MRDDNVFGERDAVTSAAEVSDLHDGICSQLAALPGLVDDKLVNQEGENCPVRAEKCESGIETRGLLCGRTM